MLEFPVTAWQTHFEIVDDPRKDYLIDHPLLEIIIIAICAVICGADDWVAIETWAKTKEEWLKKFLELENGIPTHYTFRRVFAQIDPEQFQAGFRSWTEAVFTVTKGQVIAIDGKQMRGSKSKKRGEKAICMVSAWATENNLTLGQVKAEDKSNEIKAIPQLLELLDISGCLITIDAAGCQRKNAEIIIEQEGDYLLALKKNQGHLYEDVESVFEHATEQNFEGIDADYDRSVSQGHGRVEIRECWAIDDETQLDFLRTREEWVGLESIVMIRSTRDDGNKVTVADNYFISSVGADAQQILAAKRAHWSIENKLHWSLDVAFVEDRHQLGGHGAANMAVLRHMALSLLKQEKTAKVGVKNKRLKAAWDEDYLRRVLQAN